jgi:uncharacterized protein
MPRLRLLERPLAVCRLDADAAVPPWARGELLSITRTRTALSVVCDEDALPADAPPAERGWRALEVEGPLDFDLIGILASLTAPLAAADVPVFALSTYDTDYLLVLGRDLGRALSALERAGHEVES